MTPLKNETINATKKRYSLGEEIFNSVTHGTGTLLSVTATVLLVVFASLNRNVWGIVSGSIYGFSLIVLYLMSTLYHAIVKEKAKKVFQVIDHCSIFILIAGTYTPLSLCTLRNDGGWWLFGVIWGLTAIGITLNAISLKKFSKISILLYVLMGWSVVFMWKRLTLNMADMGVKLLLAGGIVYMIGILFYAMKKLKYMHSVWHIFVLLGSVCHFFCILLYVM